MTDARTKFERRVRKATHQFARIAGKKATIAFVKRYRPYVIAASTFLLLMVARTIKDAVIK